MGFINVMEKYFDKPDFQLYNADCLILLQSLASESIDMIFADPPYYLSNGGITCQNGQMVSVDKGDWDESPGFSKIVEITRSWITECKRVLKPNGTIWISGTHHNIHIVGYILLELEFSILNNIVWMKPNAPPNLCQKPFAHCHETLIWAKKSESSKNVYNYDVMKKWNFEQDILHPIGNQMRDVWYIPTTPKNEKIYGKHPTQKPIELLKRCILSSTNINDMVLDPFNGSGTTGIVASMFNRKYKGGDKSKEYLDITIKRYDEIQQNIQNSLDGFFLKK